MRNAILYGECNELNPLPFAYIHCDAYNESSGYLYGTGMSTRNRKTHRRAQENAAEESVEAVTIWQWLKRKENRAVLEFIGAGIVALIGLLTTMGVLHHRPANAPPSITSSPAAASARVAAPQAQPVNQNATANGGVATNNNGSNNEVRVVK